MLKKRLLMQSVLLVLLFSGFLNAAFEPGRLPCVYLANGSAGIATDTDGTYFLVNPAVLAFVNVRQVALHYRNFYGLPQINAAAISFNAQVYKIPVGFAICQYGEKRYREQQVSFSAAFAINKDLVVGVSGRWYYLAISKYGHYNAAGIVLGCQWQTFPWLRLAAVTGNINEPHLTSHSDDIPVYFISGMQIRPVEHVWLFVDLFKDNRFAFDYRFGVNYELTRAIAIHLGMRQQENIFSFGLGFRKKIIAINFALEYHPQLGLSNAISVGYEF